MIEQVDWAQTAFPAREYEALLEALLTLGYKDVALPELDREQRHMFLRHDVDLSLDHALRIARRESDIGVRSTFYVLVSTSLYSVTSASSRSILSDIISLGHHVGLHFDVEQYPGQLYNLDDCAQRECDLLAQCTGTSVESISFHRPAPEYLNRPGRIAGRRHCYEPAFFSEIGYISDSNGEWRHGHPLDHPAVAQGRAIQLLTHPIWWCNETPLSTVETMNHFYATGRRVLLESLGATVTAYRQALDSQTERHCPCLKELGSVPDGG